jgi:hypothetical protein
MEHRMSGELVVRPKHEIAVCPAPVKPGERMLLSNIAQLMKDRGINCFLRADNNGIALVAT